MPGLKNVETMYSGAGYDLKVPIYSPEELYEAEWHTRGGIAAADKLQEILEGDHGPVVRQHLEEMLDSLQQDIETRLAVGFVLATAREAYDLGVPEIPTARINAVTGDLFFDSRNFWEEVVPAVGKARAVTKFAEENSSLEALARQIAESSYPASANSGSEAPHLDTFAKAQEACLVSLEQLFNPL